MGVAQEFQQVQKQTQSLILAPQLRNSLKILQAAAMDLRTSILEELQANPLLEELPIESISVEERRRARGQRARAQRRARMTTGLQHPRADD